MISSFRHNILTDLKAMFRSRGYDCRHHISDETADMLEVIKGKASIKERCRQDWRNPAGNMKKSLSKRILPVTIINIPGGCVEKLWKM